MAHEIALPYESIITALFMYHFRESYNNICVHKHSNFTKDYQDDFLDLEVQLKKRFNLRSIYTVKCHNVKLLFTNDEKTRPENIKSIYNIYHNLCFNKRFQPKVENIITIHNIGKFFHRGLIYAGSKFWVECNHNGITICEYYRSNFKYTYDLKLISKKRISESDNHKMTHQSDHVDNVTLESA